MEILLGAAGDAKRLSSQRIQLLGKLGQSEGYYYRRWKVIRDEGK